MRSVTERLTIIEDIARETNLLSLEAAIKAGRIGKAGGEIAALVSRISQLSAACVSEVDRARRELEVSVPGKEMPSVIPLQEDAGADRPDSGGESLPRADYGGEVAQ